MDCKKSSLAFIMSIVLGLVGQTQCGQINGSSKIASTVRPIAQALLQGFSSSCNNALRQYKTYPVAFSLLALNTWVYAAQLGAKANGSDLIAKFGLRNKPIQRGEWWRFFTSMFLHVNFLHVAMNMNTLLNLRPLEPYLGSKKFLGFYMASGLIANLVSYWVNKSDDVTVGASGALYGLLGALYGRAIKQESASYKNVAKSVAKTVIPGLLLSVSGILRQNHVVHAGGLASGYILGKYWPIR
jgi:rhomboid protease GluP